MIITLAVLLAAALVALAVALTLLLGARGEAARLTREAAADRVRAESAEAARIDAERAQALAEQAVALERARMGDLDQARKDAVVTAQAAALASSRELSAKLIDDHKREAELQRKEAEERVRLATEKLYQSVEKVTASVSALNSQVAKNQDTVETVKRALLSPGGAGSYAEIGLENTLKTFGLEPGRDFRLQATVAGEEGARLRPDALVFMPGDTVLVIDSKASKYLLEHAAAKDEDGAAAAAAGLAATMNKHLKALAAKDYRSAVEGDYRQSLNGREPRRILSVMYLPNEGALERLANADQDFVQKAAKAEIILVGPAGLASLIGFARVEIDLGRQAMNRERIVEASRALLEAIPVAFGYLDKVGKGIKSAADAFQKLGSSLNQRLLPRAKMIIDLGVRPSAGKDLPAPLPSFQVVTQESGLLIEGEAEDTMRLAPPASGSPN
ncbi:MAG: DNA recombination protein RmuC [Alphaproteobacteria bacterium]|nr:DNA recombination protein RmuC [Alphaproteobacteria bacterium]